MEEVETAFCQCKEVLRNRGALKVLNISPLKDWQRFSKVGQNWSSSPQTIGSYQRSQKLNGKFMGTHFSLHLFSFPFHYIHLQREIFCTTVKSWPVNCVSGEKICSNKGAEYSRKVLDSGLLFYTFLNNQTYRNLAVKQSSIESFKIQTAEEVKRTWIIKFLPFSPPIGPIQTSCLHRRQ